MAGAHQRSRDARLLLETAPRLTELARTAPHVARHEPGRGHPDRDQQRSRDDEETQHRVPDPPRGLAEMRAERVGERHGRAIDALDLVEQRTDQRRVGIRLDQHVDALTDALEGHDLLVGRCPDVDGARHVRHAPEVHEERDQPRDVVGVDAALQESCSCRVEIGLGPVERETCAPVAERDRHRRAERLPVERVMRRRIALQAMDGGLLSFDHSPSPPTYARTADSTAISAAASRTRVDTIATKIATTGTSFPSSGRKRSRRRSAPSAMGA